MGMSALITSVHTIGMMFDLLIHKWVKRGHS